MEKEVNTCGALGIQMLMERERARRLDAEHLADRPRLLEVFPGDWLIVLNVVNDAEHQRS